MTAGDGATVIATVATEDDPTAGGIIAMEYAAGAATTTGGTFAGKRLVLLTGSREASGVTSQTAGLYDLTETGKAIFLECGRLHGWNTKQMSRQNLLRPVPTRLT